MKKSLLLLSAGLILAMASSIGAHAAGVSAIDGECNIRSGPGTEYSRIGTLYSDTPLEHTGSVRYDNRGAAWYSVKCGSEEGWVSSKYAVLDEKGSGSSDVCFAAVTAKVYSGPGTGFETVGTLEAGGEVKYTGKSECDSVGVRWYCVKYKGSKAWVSSEDTYIGK